MKSGTSRRLIFALVLVLVNLAWLYAATVVLRAVPMYRYLKSQKLGWSAGILQADPELGLAHVPSGCGAQLLPIGPEVPVCADEHGFRVPAAAQGAGPEAAGPLIMAFGCSFTFGSSCAAEDTYPYVLARRLHGRAMNTAVCSHGLAQMLILARRWIPQLHPDLVVAQYSPWLVDRAVRPFAPTYFGRLPVPYFTAGPDGQVRLVPPAFQPAAFRVPAARYRHTPAGVRDFLSFLARVGFPLITHDDRGVAGFRWRSLRKRQPPPAADTDRVTAEVYREIAALCRAQGAQLFIVLLGKDQLPVEAPPALRELGVPIVDAQTALTAQLPEPTEAAYNRLYALWRGEPPVVVDSHPNALAQARIAEALAAAIETHPRSTP